MIIRLALPFLVATAAFAIHADNLCIRNGFCEDLKDLKQEIMAIGEDRRMHEDEYADKGLPYKVPVEEVQKRFAPTGRLNCPGGPGSGQITGGSNVMTTVAHNFYDRKTCKQVDDPSKCTFEVKVGKIKRSSKIKLVDMGFKCPGGKQSPYDDWAVFTLDPPIEGFGHYGIPEEDHVIREGDDIVSVLSGSEDFPDRDSKGGVKTPLTYSKTIENCKGEHIYYGGGNPRLHESTCDASKISSGGSILQRIDKEDILAGILSSGQETDEDLRRAKAEKKEVRKSYKKGEWTSFIVPFKGRFRQTVLNAVEQRI